MLMDKKDLAWMWRIVGITQFFLCVWIYFCPPPYYAVWLNPSLFGPYVQKMPSPRSSHFSSLHCRQAKTDKDDASNHEKRVSYIILGDFRSWSESNSQQKFKSYGHFTELDWKAGVMNCIKWPRLVIGGFTQSFWVMFLVWNCDHVNLLTFKKSWCGNLKTPLYSLS